MRESFEGKVVAVTGAAGGIGRALCERFARDGARIAMLDLPLADQRESRVRKGSKVTRGSDGALRWNDGVDTQIEHVEQTLEGFQTQTGVPARQAVGAQCQDRSDFPSR